jgi:ribA/ribD-fused uncharacterized protein
MSPGRDITDENELRGHTLFDIDQSRKITLSRLDPTHPLASYSRHGIELDGAQWPSVEHYYQAMKFEDEAYREEIRNAAHPADAAKLGKSKKHGRRKDWDKVKETYMTRGNYIKCRTHPEVAQALLATGELQILETNQYDYFWGCGRDTRGHNTYGKVLMKVREQLHKEALEN